MPRPDSRLIRIREPSGEEISIEAPRAGADTLSGTTVAASSTKVGFTRPGFSMALAMRSRRDL
ncbi:hypothetical protein GALL_528240 [mine drainage metagenome]|uniref:Uncharacterized protein n=1 Tax=mine drainage metagenome TaxID=410659 RepID=A0A1J5P236_9ZZZZ